MSFLEKHSVFIGGKRISLLTSDLVALSKDVALVEEIYQKTCNEYNNKLDRETVFLLMIFILLHEKKNVMLQDAADLSHFIVSLSNDIDSFTK